MSDPATLAGIKARVTANAAHNLAVHTESKRNGRPPKGADKRYKRDVYLSDAEYAEVCEKAAAAGIKPSPYMRLRVLSQQADR